MRASQAPEVVVTTSVSTDLVGSLESSAYIDTLMPVVLGKNGVEAIVEIDLNEKEKNALMESAKGVKQTNSLLTDLGS